jgi:hypothetical protein
MSKSERSAILIDGESTVEVDVTASQLTILYAKLGQTPNWTEDPYNIRDIPRSVSKGCIVAYIGKGGRPRRWPKNFDKKFVQKNGFHPREQFTLKEVLDAIEAAHPPLKLLVPNELDWATLQYEEAECFGKAMKTMLIDLGIGCLPVHDCLIVPASKKLEAENAIEEAYLHRLVVSPLQTVSPAGAKLCQNSG